MTQLEIVFAIALGAKVLAELGLEVLNRSRTRRMAGRIPEHLKGTMDEATYAKANAYTLEKSSFGSLELIFDGAILAAVVLSGILPDTFEWWKGWLGESGWSMALYLISLTVVLGLPNIPFDLYGQFKIEQKYGFNKSSVGLWVSDKLKGFALGLALGFPLLWLLLSLVDWLGGSWWIWGFAALFGFQLVMMVLYPMLIVPLFNKLSPLEDGPLKERLMELSDRTGFRARTIQVIDGSKRSGHSNAYFTGFGKFRRIVLYDTLMAQLGERELEAVLAHEIGHYKLGHIPKMIASSSLMMLGGFWIVDQLAFGRWSEWFFHGFGFEEGHVAIAFLLFSMVGGAFTYWLSPLFKILSRKHEYEADAFAKDALGEAAPMSAALRKLSEKNLSNLNPHPLYSGFHYSHPTLAERERALFAAG